MTLTITEVINSGWFHEIFLSGNMPIWKKKLREEAYEKRHATKKINRSLCGPVF